MTNSYVDITVVLDRSGSMEVVRQATINGLIEFIGRQKMENPGARLTVVQFDDYYETMVDNQPIGEVHLHPEMYVPRGSARPGCSSSCRPTDRRMRASPSAASASSRWSATRRASIGGGSSTSGRTRTPAAHTRPSHF